MQRRLRLFILIALCAAVTALGCRAASETVFADPTEAPSETPIETPSPTPIPTPVPTPEPIFLGGETFTGEETALTLVLNAEEIAILDRFPALAAVDLSGSDCYAEIAAFREAHPDVDVRYTVRIADADVPGDTEVLTLSDPVDIQLLSYLPSLAELTVENPIAPEDATALLAALPSTKLTYTASFCGMTATSEQTELDLSAVPPEQADEAVAALSALPALERVRLDPKVGRSKWSIDQAGAIALKFPSLSIDYTATVFNSTFRLTDETVAFRHIDLSRRVDDVRRILSYLKHTTRVEFEYCEIPDEQMAELRSEFPERHIVWRIFLNFYTCMTDVIMIRFSDNTDLERLYDKDTKPLIYCNDVKYLDLGHNRITDAYFCGYMPNLEVLILAVGETQDISALKNCPKLEYCELFSCKITDISALAGCTNLQHLNISRNQISDITPLYGLNKLERLWLSRNPIPESQIADVRRLLPDCEVDDTAYNPTGPGWRYYGAYVDNYTPRYRLLREQLCYDMLHIRSYSVPPTRYR